MNAEDRRTVDHEILSRYLPDFVELESDGAWVVRGTLRIQLKEAEPRAIPVRLQFAPDYPAREPFAFDAAPTFHHEMDRHFIDDQACLWFMVESRWNPVDTRALETYLDQVALFFARQVLWDAGYGWLGGQRPHGWRDAGREVIPELLGVESGKVADFLHAFAGHLREDRPCPCGSGLAYWTCHREGVLRILARYPGQPLAEVMGGFWIERRITEIGQRLIEDSNRITASLMPECRPAVPWAATVTRAGRSTPPRSE